MKKDGFSLINILIIVVVIVVVCAACYPVYLKSQEKKKETTCIANTKQIGDAFVAYMADYNDTLPTAPIGDGLMQKTWGEFYCGHSKTEGVTREAGRKSSIRAQLTPYIKDQSVFICPSDIGASLDWELNKRFTSYHYRFFIGAILTDSEFTTPWKKSMIKDPSKVFVFNDFLPFHQGAKEPDSKTGTDDLWSWTPKSRFNLVFADGHIATMPASHCMGYNPDIKRFDYHWPKVYEQPAWTSYNKLYDVE